jgi:hypothetical protein
LTPRLRNLVVAGRWASMTHDVDKFARNMAPIGLQGQAAGTFAAIAADRDWNQLPIETVRTALQRSGVPVSLGKDEPHHNIEKRVTAAA